MSEVYLSLGSNLGDKRGHLQAAVQALRQLPELQVKAQSSLYATAAWGYRDQADFLNAALRLQTEMPPQLLLQHLLAIEAAEGRVRTGKWRERSLDIDILLYGELQICEPNLQIPHPHLRERRFVLQPLLDVAGQNLLPKAQQWLAACTDKGSVQVIAAADEW